MEKNKIGDNLKLTNQQYGTYSQFCQDCEYLSSSKDMLDDHDKEIGVRGETLCFVIYAETT